MELLTLVKEFAELKAEKESLAEAVKANNKALDAKEQEVAAQMLEDDATSITYNGVKYSLSQTSKWSLVGKERLLDTIPDVMAEQGFDDPEAYRIHVFKQCGLSDIVKESIVTQSLNGRINEMLEQDEELPAELMQVISEYPQTKVSARKETAKKGVGKS